MTSDPDRVSVRFEPVGAEIDVAPGTTVLEAAHHAGIGIPAPCGGKGTCGRCAVRVLEGEPPRPNDLETRGVR